MLSGLLYDTQDKHSDGINVHCHRTDPDPSPYDSAEDDSTTVAGCSQGSQDHSERLEPENPETPASSSRRQIVGILASIFTISGFPVER